MSDARRNRAERAGLTENDLGPEFFRDRQGRVRLRIEAKQPIDFGPSGGLRFNFDPVTGEIVAGSPWGYKAKASGPAPVARTASRALTFLNW